MAHALPHVTEVLSRYSSYDRVRKDLLEEGMLRGKIVHSVCASIAEGLWYPPLPEEYQGYIISFERWFSTFVETVHFVEVLMIDTANGYQGRPDLIVTMIDGAMTLVDHKTPVAKMKTWRAQTAAYKNLAIIKGLPVERCGSLRLLPNGNPAIFDPSAIGPEDFAAFHAALQAHRYFFPEGESHD